MTAAARYLSIRRRRRQKFVFRRPLFIIFRTISSCAAIRKVARTRTINASPLLYPRECPKAHHQNAVGTETRDLMTVYSIYVYGDAAEGTTHTLNKCCVNYTIPMIWYNIYRVYLSDFTIFHNCIWKIIKSYIYALYVYIHIQAQREKQNSPKGLYYLRRERFIDCFVLHRYLLLL